MVAVWAYAGALPRLTSPPYGLIARSRRPRGLRIIRHKMKAVNEEILG